jgi:hypothetical protein
MPAATVIAATSCPLCGEANLCAMELQKATGQPQPPCWCTGVDFSAQLLERLPAASRGIACICARCAESGEPR